jgi:hypothetical protein|tara:strand:- start:353 stop:697 length:345 start_codon:yes stop_codon:yes gene_type:complete
MGKQVNKNGWVWLAPQYFSAWRFFPRAFIIFYFWLCMETAMWFMAIPIPSPSQAAFAGTIISAGAAWFGLYVNSNAVSINNNSDNSSKINGNSNDNTNTTYTVPNNNHTEGPSG